MEMTGETWRSNSPCLSEIELIVDPPATLAHRVTLEGLTFEGDPIAD
jgi:hypothetical protein